jgi:hypothetical protein
MRQRNLFLLAFLFLFTCPGIAQTFYSTGTATIPGYGSDVYDTINVSGLSPAIINGAFGLDSVSLNISYDWEPDLIVSLIAPDGTIVHLSDEFGNGADFTNTCFTMSVNNFANDASSPMSGTMQPSHWLGMLNNGHTGNGRWILHILNTNTGADAGILLNWGLTFDSTPAPPAFFDSSTLPIIVINTHDVVIPAYGDNDVAGQMGIIFNGSGIDHLSDPFNNYNGNIGIHVRGNSTRSFPAKSYEITTEDSSGNSQDASLLGMDTDHSWALYQPWDDKSLIRDVITYRLSNDMGEYASRTHFCELVLDGDYRGVYVMEDHISRGSNRVAVHKMNATDTALPGVSGGYIYEVDRAGSLGYDSWASVYGPCDSNSLLVTFAYTYPKPENIVSQQKQYIADYVDSFETQLKTGNLYDTVSGYRKYIDVATFIDQSLLQELGHNVDGYRLSSYLHKDKNSKLMGGPIWDFNEAYGNSDYYNGWAYNTWEWDLSCTLPDGNLNPFWWQRFLDDSNYVQELKCRYTHFRQNAFDTAHIHQLVDSLVNVLALPEQRHYERWPIIGVYTWPNYYVESSYADEINYLKTWIDNRLQWMDSTLYDTTCLAKVVTAGVEQIIPNGVSIYPNPVSEELNITVTGMNSVIIYNLVGQKLYENDIPAKTYMIQVPAQRFPPGIYSVIISRNDGITRNKIVITH